VPAEHLRDGLRVEGRAAGGDPAHSLGQRRDVGDPILEQVAMGAGFAVAVLIDATIVRAIVLPAAMKLLGERNWYLPSALGWLPKPRPGETEVEPAQA
jgi:hypothetical protein